MYSDKFYLLLIYIQILFFTNKQPKMLSIYSLFIYDPFYYRKRSGPSQNENNVKEK